MLKPYIARLVEQQDLSQQESRDAMALIMSGQATEAQIAGFLIALRAKGETVDEITGCALAMREAATTIEVGDLPVVDTCGTGGDRTGTFNVSTAAALVAAGAGVPVAKHGNRSVSSGSGSADVLEHLGVNIEAPVPVVERCIREAGIGFLFAPMLHKAMKHAIGPRRELAVRTVFNILGPLTNPAGARRQLLGIFSGELLETIGGVLRALGGQRAMVVHSSDGMDELSVCDTSNVVEVTPEGIERRMLDPAQFGIPRAEMSALVVDGPEQSAEAIRAILGGQQGPKRDMVTLNAGAAIYVGGKAASIEEGIQAAAAAIDSGRAHEVLEKLREISRSGS